MPSLTRVSPAQRILMKAPLRIVSIGGGTGLSTLLSGLKKHARGALESAQAGVPAVDITAVVTVSDDGGSSGRL
ncbi:MAG TPA: 2-phospho-L-lactate transferase CofD family protein, partial [Bryobacteraceae bacterium]|nr:2-phospho-L-lactate transferase CofD family protein [Bryobacteraceae bacterium]